MSKRCHRPLLDESGRIARRGLGQPCDHRNLDGGQDFPRTHTEGRKPEDAVTISLHEDLHEPAGLRELRARRLVSIGTLNRRYAIPCYHPWGRETYLCQAGTFAETVKSCKIRGTEG